MQLEKQLGKIKNELAKSIQFTSECERYQDITNKILDNYNLLITCQVDNGNNAEEIKTEIQKLEEEEKNIYRCLRGKPSYYVTQIKKIRSQFEENKERIFQSKTPKSVINKYKTDISVIQSIHKKILKDIQNPKQEVNTYFFESQKENLKNLKKQAEKIKPLRELSNTYNTALSTLTQQLEETQKSIGKSIEKVKELSEFESQYANLMKLYELIFWNIKEEFEGNNVEKQLLNLQEKLNALSLTKIPSYFPSIKQFFAQRITNIKNVIRSLLTDLPRFSEYQRSMLTIIENYNELMCAIAIGESGSGSEETLQKLLELQKLATKINHNQKLPLQYEKAIKNIKEKFDETKNALEEEIRYAKELQKSQTPENYEQEIKNIVEQYQLLLSEIKTGKSSLKKELEKLIKLKKNALNITALPNISSRYDSKFLELKKQFDETKNAIANAIRHTKELQEYKKQINEISKQYQVLLSQVKTGELPLKTALEILTELQQTANTIKPLQILSSPYDSKFSELEKQFTEIKNALKEAIRHTKELQEYKKQIDEISKQHQELLNQVKTGKLSLETALEKLTELQQTATTINPLQNLSSPYDSKFSELEKQFTETKKAIENAIDYTKALQKHKEQMLNENLGKLKLSEIQKAFKRNLIRGYVKNLDKSAIIELMKTNIMLAIYFLDSADERKEFNLGNNDFKAVYDNNDNSGKHNQEFINKIVDNNIYNSWENAQAFSGKHILPSVQNKPIIKISEERGEHTPASINYLLKNDLKNVQTKKILNTFSLDELITHGDLNALTLLVKAGKENRIKQVGNQNENISSILERITAFLTKNTLETEATKKLAAGIRHHPRLASEIYDWYIKCYLNTKDPSEKTTFLKAIIKLVCHESTGILAERLLNPGVGERMAAFGKHPWNALTTQKLVDILNVHGNKPDVIDCIKKGHWFSLKNFAKMLANDKTEQWKTLQSPQTLQGIGVDKKVSDLSIMSTLQVTLNGFNENSVTCSELAMVIQALEYNEIAEEKLTYGNDRTIISKAFITPLIKNSNLNAIEDPSAFFKDQHTLNFLIDNKYISIETLAAWSTNTAISPLLQLYFPLEKFSVQEERSTLAKRIALSWHEDEKNKCKCIPGSRFETIYRMAEIELISLKKREEIEEKFFPHKKIMINNNSSNELIFSNHTSNIQHQNEPIDINDIRYSDYTIENAEEFITRVQIVQKNEICISEQNAIELTPQQLREAFCEMPYACQELVWEKHKDKLFEDAKQENTLYLHVFSSDWIQKNIQLVDIDKISQIILNTSTDSVEFLLTNEGLIQQLGTSDTCIIVKNFPASENNDPNKTKFMEGFISHIVKGITIDEIPKIQDNKPTQSTLKLKALDKLIHDKELLGMALIILNKLLQNINNSSIFENTDEKQKIEAIQNRVTQIKNY